MLIEFPHKPPKGYSYEFEDFKKNIISVWMKHHIRYDYNLGKPVSTIWGFYNTKTKQYHCPINSDKVGIIVNIKNTTAYTAMQPKKTSLEMCFV